MAALDGHLRPFDPAVWLLQHETPEADVNDLAQEVLLALAQDLSRFDHNGRAGAFRVWVRSITANRLRAYWKTRRSRPINGLDDRIARFEDPVNEFRELWDREHDEFVIRRLLELIEPEFALSTWRSFQLLVLEEQPAPDVAENWACRSTRS